MKKETMTRALPWSLAAAAYFVPPAWAYFAMQRDVAVQRAANGWACGNPAIGMVLLSCMASGVLSLAATGLRASSVGWWKAELIALVLPLVAALAFITYLFSP